MPGITITDEDRQRIPAHFICTLCKLLLYIPMQTLCGHLMCQSCVENLLKSPNPKCPVDEEFLTEGKVHVDNLKKRELNALKNLQIHCPNLGCSVIIDYKQFEDHSEVCEHALVKCDQPQCQVVFKRSHLDEHLKNECEYRNGPIKNFVQYLCKVFTSISCYIPRPDVARIAERVRDNIVLVCTGLAEKFVMVFQNLTGLERRVEGLESSGEGDTVIRNEVEELKNKLRELTAEISNLRERNMSLEKKVRDLTAIIDRLVSRMDQMEESLAMNTVKIADLESQRCLRTQQVIHSHSGTLLWKIEGYQRKRQDAINGVKTVLYSPPFYSAQYGYKMCAKIYMNGDGFGKGSHLSLFFVVMKGDYDAIQPWPFQKKITMMLLDQGNGDHMIDEFNSDPQSSSFQRPESDMNIASGSPLFMPLDSLNNRQYIKDDVMFIMVIVD